MFWRLGDVEDALDVITQTQGQSVEAFAEQVEENRAILNQMEVRSSIHQHNSSITQLSLNYHHHYHICQH